MWLGRGHRYLNSLLIRTVQDFPLAKGVRIIEVGLYICVHLEYNCNKYCDHSEISVSHRDLEIYKFSHARAKKDAQCNSSLVLRSTTMVAVDILF